MVVWGENRYHDVNWRDILIASYPKQLVNDGRFPKGSWSERNPVLVEESVIRLINEAMPGASHCRIISSYVD